jgi:hypothetical protein
MYDQEYGLEHGGVAKQLNQVQAAYERGLRDAAELVEPNLRTHSELIPSALTAKAILALKDRGAKGDGE